MNQKLIDYNSKGAKIANLSIAQTELTMGYLEVQEHNTQTYPNKNYPETFAHTFLHTKQTC
jgi:hypothetical protein